MTDVSSLPAHADPQPPSAAFDAGPPPPAFATASPRQALDGTAEAEESSTIKCICSFSDDDGNTVLCEKCDTWQHIVCYYESTQHVPDVHECTDCQPRPVDARRAAEKQRLRRELHNIGERKGRPKPIGTKNHKKRPKDSISQPNGWPQNSNNDLHYNPERKSGSPRDQPPPSKRPKTTHRPSGSISTATTQPATLAPTGRKRGASFAANTHNPVKSPTTLDGPMEDFSLEFMNLYTQPEPPSADGNSYTSLGVASDIAMWLKDPDALAEVSGGKKPQELFSRIENTIQELESSTAPHIEKQTEVDSSITAHGLHPQWTLVTVDRVIPEGGYIGELKGLVGRKDDYFQDPTNRWSLLRHPEPFVFFPPNLPIYIDTRQEGNLLRYTRRSCSPNMVMKILVDSSNDYHFCFVALRQIEQNEEITIGWDIDSEVQKQLARVITNGAREGFRRIQPWASCVLANFGGCACNHSAGHECLLERARRNTTVEPAQPRAKSKKAKKAHVSPPSTGRATNSRAGSESRHRDAADEDNMDGRSTSGSHKSSSRDITPATHASADGDSKMSERDKRKLQQQERLFEQLEAADHKGKKAKRNSAGSNLNTSSTSSKRPGQSELSPSARHREHSHGVARKASGSSMKTNGKSASKPKPIYKDSFTQTEHNGAVAVNASTGPREMRPPPMSYKLKLLQQAKQDKQQRERMMRSTSIKMESSSPGLKDVASTRPSPLPLSPPQEDPSAMDITMGTEHNELTPAKEPSPASITDAGTCIDVEMTDADAPAQRMDSTVDQHKAEKPATVAPGIDEDIVPTPKAQEPDTDVLMTDSPANGESKVDEPKVDEPEVNEPKVDEPKVDEPKVDEPKVDEPKVDEPKVNEPKVDEMDVDKLKIDEAKIGEPKVDGPKVDQPKVDTSTNKPADKATDKPVNKPTDKASGKTVDKTTDKTTDKPTVRPTDKPIGKSTQKSADNPADKPTNTSTDKVIDRPTKSTDKSSDKSVDKPAKLTDKPEKLTGKHVDKPKADESKVDKNADKLKGQEPKVDKPKASDPEPDKSNTTGPKVEEPRIEESKVETPNAPVQQAPALEVSDLPTKTPASKATSPFSPHLASPDTNASKASVSLNTETPMKPELTNPFAGGSSLSPNAVRPGSNGTIREKSPGNVSVASPFSPAVNNSVGPVRKKLSLSDYTSRKKLAQTTNGPPALVPSQSTSSPTLSAASQPNNTSPSVRSTVSLTAVTEELQPLDLEAPAAAPATSTST